MTNTNPLTDRLQREYAEDMNVFVFKVLMELGYDIKAEEYEHIAKMMSLKTKDLVSHTIKETLTAFQGDPLGLFTVAHTGGGGEDYIRGASDQFLADQKKIKDILTTLTSSPEIGKE